MKTIKSTMANIKVLKDALYLAEKAFYTHDNTYVYLSDSLAAEGAMSYRVAPIQALNIGIHPLDLKHLGLVNHKGNLKTLEGGVK